MTTDSLEDKKTLKSLKIGLKFRDVDFMGSWEIVEIIESDRVVVVLKSGEAVQKVFIEDFFDVFVGQL